MLIRVHLCPSVVKLPMQRSSINPAILQPMLESAANAADKGQSQFFTPPALAKALGVLLPRHRNHIVDLNCGDGALLCATANSTTQNLLGCDIDPSSTSLSSFAVKISRDLTLLYSLLKEVRWAADLFTLNPPWRLEWHADRLALLAESELDAVRFAYKSAIRNPQSAIDSSLATILIALDLCTHYGEGYLITNNATAGRLIFADDAPAAAIARHIWLKLIIPGNPMTGLQDCKWAKDGQFETVVLFFAASHETGPFSHHVDSTLLASLLPSFVPPGGIKPDPDPLRLLSLRSHRMGPALTGAYVARKDAAPLWQDIRDEIARQDAAQRGSDPGWHLWLENGHIRVNLSRFEQKSAKTDKAEAARLFALAGKQPMQLVLQRHDRKELLHVAQAAGWRVHPLLLEAVQKAAFDYHAARAPLYPLNKTMRLGYLDEQDTITCERALYFTGNTGPNRVNAVPSPGGEGQGEGFVSDPDSLVFRAGQKYSLRTQTVEFSRTGLKPNAITGRDEPVTYTGQELCVFIRSHNGFEFAFLDERLRDDNVTVTVNRLSNSSKSAIDRDPVDFTLTDLTDHFEIPDVPDVATLNPEGYRAALESLAAIEKTTGVRLRNFQREHMARAALHDGIILGWDTGLGKSLAMILFPLLKVGYTVME